MYKRYHVENYSKGKKLTFKKPRQLTVRCIIGSTYEYIVPWIKSVKTNNSISYHVTHHTMKATQSEEHLGTVLVKKHISLWEAQRCHHSYSFPMPTGDDDYYYKLLSLQVAVNLEAMISRVGHDDISFWGQSQALGTIQGISHGVHKG